MADEQPWSSLPTDVVAWLEEGRVEREGSRKERFAKGEPVPENEPAITHTLPGLPPRQGRARRRR